MTTATTAPLTLALAICLGLAGSATALETGDLDVLREEALAQVNADRAEQDLPPLTLQEALNEAAQSHAEDMIENDYYAHVSPEGVGPQDRFLDQGGGRAKVVRENIARCSGCALPPDEERVESFETGWMNSPPHRENILSEGLQGFGFGIAGEEGRIVAVQTFAGPGVPPALGPDQQPSPIAEAERSNTMVEMLNRAREREGLPALANSETLAQAARNLLPEEDGGLLDQDGESDLYAALPEGARRDWRSLRLISAGCGGCGAEITDADLRYFREQWLDNPQFTSAVTNERFDAAGAAFLASGEGAKRAILVLGTSR
ncbi:CAP domain-containing protein [Jiella avicenniae]|uniref:CAP domain-containing protein n=1 Tax=Jiella avicenniae TaxID=2907202 RepID=A0A9X1T5K3_9HYPH|nr:CAP domain-containing protein [Jiella avicenniae]MCE7029651.1 CAP domain-containing protein [Jiella avicenniae]